MTREEYIAELRARIAHLPREEREAALAYYMEYLEDAADKSMEEIIAELGTPRDVAERIIADCSTRTDSSSGCIIGAVALLTSPLWLLFAFIFGVTGFSILLTVLILLVVFAALAILFVGLGIWAMFVHPATGILMLGGACIMAAIATLLVLLFSAAGSAAKAIAAAVKNRRRGFER